jgi:hypothetical protein
VSTAATAPTRSKDRPDRFLSPRDKRIGYPHWAQAKREAPKNGYIQLPEKYLYPSLQDACTYLAYRLLLRMAIECYRYDGQRWEYTDRNAEEFAKELNVSKDGISKALLELRGKGFAEAEEFKNRTLYRPLEDAFPADPVPKKPPQREEGSCTGVLDDNAEDEDSVTSDKEEQEKQFPVSSPFQKRVFRIARGQHRHRAKVGFFVERFEHESDSELDGFGELTFEEGTLRFCSRIGRQAEEKSPSDIPRAAERAAASGHPARDKFPIFMDACARAELPASRVDWERARKTFAKLTVEQQMAAVRGIEDRIACGEFHDKRFSPRPDKFLGDFAWERPLRTKGSKASSEEKIARAMRHAAELEGRRRP